MSLWCIAGDVNKCERNSGLQIKDMLTFYSCDQAVMWDEVYRSKSCENNWSVIYLKTFCRILQRSEQAREKQPGEILHKGGRKLTFV